MKTIVIYVCLIGCSFLFGCSADEDRAQKDENQIQNINNDYYNSNQGQAEQLGTNEDNNYSRARNRDELLEGYLTELEKPDGDNSEYTEGYYSKESKKITDEINRLDSVDLTQVIVLDNRILISPMLDQTEYSVNTDDIIDDIYNRVKKMYPDKEVIVDSDAIYWNKMRDLNARWED